MKCPDDEGFNPAKALGEKSGSINIGGMLREKIFSQFTASIPIILL